MNRHLSMTLGMCLLGAVLGSGCAWRPGNEFCDDGDHYAVAATEIEYPDVASCRTDPIESQAPLSLKSDAPTEYWDLSLEESVQLALMNSQILRDLGGTVLRNPATTPTIYGPAIRETDPRSGIEAALSAFDAQLATSALFEKNDKALNNVILGGGTRLLQQDLIAWQTELRKRSAVGTEMVARHTTDYDANNAPGNRFFSAWNTAYEVELRQPWLQGAGLDFNRIAGANLDDEERDGNHIPGLYNGVLIARVNTDIELAEFERAVRDEVSNVENAYWDLYYAYRDLDAKISARDAALETWRRIRALYDTGRVGGEADKEAQAREQYFRFEEEVQNSLSGRLIDGTRTNNGSSGGSFRPTSGVHVAERRLRLLLGLPTTDGRLIRPASEPALVPIAFDWGESTTEAVARRVELRKQRWAVKRRELELLASRNFLLPRLDTFGRYRWRGFGHDLISANGGKPRFDNAYADLVSGDFQEWGLGVELSMPLGFRRGHAAVRNANLHLARERAVLEEQERQVLYGLSNGIAELERAFTVSKTAYNRRVAAYQQLAAVEAAYDERPDLLDRLLDAQRRVADSESRYHQSLVEYALAVKNVHFEKGSLLDHAQVHLAEGPWPGKAYHDAARRERLRGPERAINYAFAHGPRTVSRGPVGPASLRASEEVAIGTTEHAPPQPTQAPGDKSANATETSGDVQANESSRRAPEERQPSGNVTAQTQEAEPQADAGGAEPPLPAPALKAPRYDAANSDVATAQAATPMEQGQPTNRPAQSEALSNEALPKAAQTATISDTASEGEALGEAPLPTVTPIPTQAPATMPIAARPQMSRPVLAPQTAAADSSATIVPSHLDPAAAWPGARGKQLSGDGGAFFVEEVEVTRNVPVSGIDVSMPRPDLESYDSRAAREAPVRRESTPETAKAPSATGQDTTRMVIPSFEVPEAPTEFYEEQAAEPPLRTGRHPAMRGSGTRKRIDRDDLGRNPQVWNRGQATAAREGQAATTRIEVAPAAEEVSTERKTSRASEAPAAAKPQDAGLGKKRQFRR